MKTLPKAHARHWFRIENAASDEATVYLYDAIDSFWGINAQEFVKEFTAITAATIHLRINSPGGFVFDAMAIHGAVQRHPSMVIAHIDGLAASAASFIALAANEVRMAQGAMYMIHNGHAFAIGDKHVMRETADLLDKVDGTIRDIYVRKTGKSPADVEELMDAESWFTADEALEAGFIDVVESAEPVEAAFDLSGFKHVPPQAKAIAGAGAAGRNAKKPETIRDFETLLRDEGGFSHAEAKKIAAGGYKALATPRDEEDDPADPAPDEGEDDLAALNAAILSARFACAVLA